MAELRIRTARHTVRVAAPPRTVYRLIADAGRWPMIFDPMVTVEHLGFDGISERVRSWVLVDDEVQSRVSHRELNPHRLQIRFRQENPPHPVATMGGLWLVVPKGNGSLVALDHYYRVVDDNPADAQRLAAAVDRNGVTVLSALRDTAELGAELDQLWLSCEDSVDIDGDARDVYDFFARTQDWPQRLPHGARLTLDENVVDIRHIETDAQIPADSVDTTNTVRVCYPETHIVFKRTRLPAIMRAHTGSWTVNSLRRGVRASALHTVLLRRETVAVLNEAVLNEARWRSASLIGPESTLDDARAVVRQELSTLSLATLGRAKAFAEARRPVRMGRPA